MYGSGVEASSSVQPTPSAKRPDLRLIGRNLAAPGSRTV